MEQEWMWGAPQQAPVRVPAGGRDPCSCSWPRSVREKAHPLCRDGHGQGGAPAGSEPERAVRYSMGHADSVVIEALHGGFRDIFGWKKTTYHADVALVKGEASGPDLMLHPRCRLPPQALSTIVAADRVPEFVFGEERHVVGCMPWVPCSVSPSCLLLPATAKQRRGSEPGSFILVQPLADLLAPLLQRGASQDQLTDEELEQAVESEVGSSAGIHTWMMGGSARRDTRCSMCTFGDAMPVTPVPPHSLA